MSENKIEPESNLPSTKSVVITGSAFAVILIGSLAFAGTYAAAGTAEAESKSDRSSSKSSQHPCATKDMAKDVYKGESGSSKDSRASCSISKKGARDFKKSDRENNLKKGWASDRERPIKDQAEIDRADTDAPLPNENKKDKVKSADDPYLKDKLIAKPPYKQIPVPVDPSLKPKLKKAVKPELKQKLKLDDRKTTMPVEPRVEILNNDLVEENSLPVDDDSSQSIDRDN